MDNVSKWLDVTVLMTNLYNDCSLDYMMQQFGGYTSSLSGFLDLITNLMFRIFADDDVTIYTNLSTAQDSN